MSQAPTTAQAQFFETILAEVTRVVRTYVPEPRAPRADGRIDPNDQTPHGWLYIGQELQSLGREVEGLSPNPTPEALSALYGRLFQYGANGPLGQLAQELRLHRTLFAIQDSIRSLLNPKDRQYALSDIRDTVTMILRDAHLGTGPALAVVNELMATIRDMVKREFGESESS